MSNQHVTETSTDKTQHPQEIYIHGPGGSQTRDPSKRAAAESHFKGPTHPKSNCAV